MKELSAQQTQLLIDYLNKRIDRNRAAAETYASSGNHQLAMLTNGQAAEADCALAFLMGLMFEE